VPLRLLVAFLVLGVFLVLDAIVILRPSHRRLLTH
jgi:hypothetical protein